MGVEVKANPTALTWKHYKPAVHVKDPDDHTEIDAYTRFAYEIKNKPVRKVGDQFALADPVEITISIKEAKVKTGAAQTADLLAHEQLHFDVGILVGRAAGRELNALREKDMRGLGASMNDVADLHFQTRAGAIQRKYDVETKHGKNGTMQKKWSDAMSKCMDDEACSEIIGLPL
jgi:hypothetical protein